MQCAAALHALAGCAAPGAPPARPTPAPPLAGPVAAARSNSEERTAEPSTTSEPAPAEPVAAPGPDEPLVPADFRASFSSLGPPSVSLGHAGGRWRSTRWANAPGARAWASGDAPPGATLVAEHGTPPDVGPILVMQKRARGYDPRHGDWHYAVLATDLRVLRQGRLAECGGCHATARRDHLLGVP